MKTRLLTRLAAVSVLSCIGVLGTSATGAFAVAVQVPVGQLPTIFPFPGPIVDLLGKGVLVIGNCPSWVVDDNLGFSLTGANAHVYGPGPHPLTNGANITGDSILTGAVTGLTPYEGETHLWFGTNVNPTGNLQNYSGATAAFHGTAPDGSSIQINASGGGGSSASGNPTGWGHIKVTCS